MVLHQRVSLAPPASTASATDLPALGTIRFSGEVPPTKGLWYGVEWDDPSRGKHSGVYEKTGVQYFECRVPGTGSFIRQHTPGLSFGVSFQSALRAKYLPEEVEVQHSDGEERSQFFDTDSNFQVEVVPMGKIRDRFRALEKVKEVGLEWEGVASAEHDVEIAFRLEQMNVLNMSYCLLSTWDTVRAIVAELPALRTLSLNSNRFARVNIAPELPALSQLTALNLNRTMVDWNEMLLLSPSLSNLQHLQLGDNALTSLNSPAELPLVPVFSKLETLNLEGNDLRDWENVISALSNLNALTRLILSSNQLETIPPTSPTLSSLRHLSLASNRLSSWSSLDALNTQLPFLTSLAIGDNPLFKGKGEAGVRLEIIARIAGLRELEGSRVSDTEREDSELYYLTCIAREEGSDADKEVRHPRRKELLLKHGQTAKAPENKQSSLKGRLIHLSLTPPASLSSIDKPTTLAVLPTIRTLQLRTQIARLLSVPVPKTRYRLVAILRPDREEGDGADVEGLRVEIPVGEEGRELSWWGVGDGDEIRVEEV